MRAACTSYYTRVCFSYSWVHIQGSGYMQLCAGALCLLVFFFFFLLELVILQSVPSSQNPVKPPELETVAQLDIEFAWCISIEGKKTHLYNVLWLCDIQYSNMPLLYCGLWTNNNLCTISRLEVICWPGLTNNIALSSDNFVLLILTD